MYEIMVVLLIYALLSLAGMTVVWTVAANKEIVRPPSFFFWMRTRGIQPQADALLCDERSNTCSPAFACNIALGAAKDSPAILRRAADYLERNGH